MWGGGNYCKDSNTVVKFEIRHKLLWFTWSMLSPSLLIRFILFLLSHPSTSTFHPNIHLAAFSAPILGRFPQKICYRGKLSIYGIQWTWPTPGHALPTGCAPSATPANAAPIPPAIEQLCCYIKSKTNCNVNVYLSYNTYKFKWLI